MAVAPIYSGNGLGIINKWSAIPWFSMNPAYGHWPPIALSLRINQVTGGAGNGTVFGKRE
jgi:hypothetical protein